MRKTVFVTRKPHERDVVCNRGIRFRLGCCLAHQAETDVFADGLPRQQRKLLEYHRAFGSWAADLRAAHQHAPFGWKIKPRCHAHQGGLAAARGTDNGHKFLFLDTQIDVINGQEVSTLRQRKTARHALKDYFAQACPHFLLKALSTARSATSIAKPTTPMPIMPAMTTEVFKLPCPCTIR